MIFQLAGTIIALVLIFIFAINKFSRQVEGVAGEKFKNLIRRLTNTPVKGTITGTVVTSVLQSSTATTVMTVGLVNAGMITFRESIGVIFGANIGTTITSQLIALNLTAVAPFIIILGFLVLQFGGNYKHYGKSIFYFGLVFFCISLITQVVSPLSENQTIINILSHTRNLPIAIISGIILTTILQSSSIASGLILALATTGVLDLNQGIGIMLGANIGTTSTALLASIPMNLDAKKAAITHALFNIGGCIAVLPFLGGLTKIVQSIGTDIPQQIANMHLAFNLFSTVLFLILFKQFIFIIEWVSKQKFLHIDTKKWEPKI